MSAGYPLAMSSDEVTRLRVQSDLFRAEADDMLSAIGVRPGWRCLDLCSGVGGIVDLLSHHAGPGGDVVGLEADPAKLRVAEAWARASGYDNARFVLGDAFATGLEPASFDLVHARFALSIVPGGAGMLGHALALLRPGGIVFLEEVEWGSTACHPPSPAWERAAVTVEQCFRRIGSDLRLGRKLPGLLAAAGVDVIRLRPCCHALRAGEPMHHHVPLTLAAMRESVIAEGLMDAATLDATVAQAHAHLARPEAVTLSFTMLQVVGRPPS